MTAKKPEDARLALVEAQRWMAPADMHDLVRSLGELYIASAKARDAAEDMQAQIALYAKRLREYPADIALDAINGWRGKFFPSLNELRDKIEDDTRLMRRRIYIKALRRFLDKADNPPKPPPTKEQRAKISAGFESLARELGGGR